MTNQNIFRSLPALLILCAGFLQAQQSESQNNDGLLPMAEWSSWMQSEAALFRLRYHSEMGAIRINEMHSWELQLQDAEGQPIEGANIEVNGGMPVHNHGLATSPVVEPTTEPGLYRLSGLRFHMPGEWLLQFSVSAGHSEDDVSISLQL